jgi:hypothetical protein
MIIIIRAPICEKIRVAHSFWSPDIGPFDDAFVSHGSNLTNRRIQLQDYFHGVQPPEFCDVTVITFTVNSEHLA